MIYKKQVIKCICIFFVLSVVLFGCSSNDTHKLTNRSTWFKKNKSNDIIIGVAAPLSTLKQVTLYHEGLFLAAEQFNSNGGLNGRKLKFIEADDEGSVTKGAGTAYDFVKNPALSAVIGHWNSPVSRICAQIYDEAGLTMITPSSTASNVIEDKYKYIFRGLTDDTEMGKQMAEYASTQNLRRVAIVYSDDDYGRSLSNSFCSAAKDKNIKIVERTMQLSTDVQIRRFIEKCKAMDYDSIFIADSITSSGSVINFIKKVRIFGEDIEIMGADGLDSEELVKSLGSKADGIVFGTHYNLENLNEKNIEFKKKFYERYNKTPDTWAAIGYETVTLLTESMKKTDSVSPDAIAKYLHVLKDWNGVTGKISFAQNGEITGKKIAKKTVVNGKFKFLTEE